MKKRLFSILLVLCMALTMLPVTALAGVVSSGTYDIAINGTKWKFEQNESGEYIPVYYYANNTFSTDANDKINKYYTNDNLVLTKEGDTVTISFRRGTSYQSDYYHQVKFTIKSEAKGSDISCIEMGSGNNLVITGEGTKGTLFLTRNGKDGIGAALSSKEGNITITGGATVNVTFKKQSTPNVSGHAISVDNHDLIISGAGTTVEAENQSGASQDFSNDATVWIKGGRLVVSNGAWLKATNEFTNTNKPYSSDFNNYSYFSCAISGGKSAPCTVSVTGEKSRITASAYNSTKYDVNTSMGQAYRWADFDVNGAKIEVDNSTESTVDGIKGHQYVTIHVPTAPAPHVHTFGDTWTSDATNHWKTCKDCDAIIEEAAHSGGTATCTAKRVCTVCNQSYGEFDPSKHTALSDWTSDATGHWKVCTDCKATDIDKDSHNYGEWQITQGATATKAGSQYRECSVCHYKETVTIPATGPCTHEGTLKYTDNGDWSTHKVECTACGQVINAKEAHAIHGYRINDVAGTHQEFCNKCSYIGHPLQHTNIYIADGDGHYKKCGICGVTTGMKEAHNFENGKCTACGAADPTYVPPTDPDPVEPTPGGSVIIITPEATGPVFLSGANQTVALGSAAAFRIDYNYAAFRSVAVDGVTLDPTSYTTWEGSTWVKLTPAYVKTLGIGTHTLSVYFDGATATTTFTVGSQPNPATGARDAVGIAAAAAVIALLGSAALLRKK